MVSGKEVDQRKHHKTQAEPHHIHIQVSCQAAADTCKLLVVLVPEQLAAGSLLLLRFRILLLNLFRTADDVYDGTDIGQGGHSVSAADIVSLAAAYPALKDYYPEEAERSLKNAVMLWDKYYEAAAPNPNIPQQENRRWGGGGDPRINAAIELWIATGEQKYKDFFLPLVEKQLDAKPVAPRSNGNVQNGMFSTQFTGGPNLTAALKIYPYMDKQFQDKVKALVPAYVNVITRGGQDNPYGVAIGGATWAGNASVINIAYNCYKIWKYFPDMIDPEYVFAGLNFIFGCHPYSNVSFVEGVGVNTKKVAYNNNRADYSTIPGGIVPGLLVKEDFFENKDDYPFHWGENEACINTAPQYVLLCLAAIEVAEYLNK